MMAGLSLSGESSPLFDAADKLRYVKELAWGLALDKLGIGRHRRYDDQPDDIKYLYNKILPALVAAILADDPDWTPDDDWIKGHRPPTIARGTTAVRWFVEIQEASKALLELSPDMRSGALYDRMYREHEGQGSFLADLRTALMKGDPDWRGPLPTGGDQ